MIQDGFIRLYVFKYILQQMNRFRITCLRVKYIEYNNESITIITCLIEEKLTQTAWSRWLQHVVPYGYKKRGYKWAAMC